MLSSRPVTMLHSSQIINNENAAAPSKTAPVTTIKDPTLTVHKTPAGTKSRRAFGDISNKRPQKYPEEGNESAWKTATVPRTPATTIIKKSSKKSTKKTSTALSVAKNDTKRGVSFADKLESSKVVVVPCVPPKVVSATNAKLTNSLCDDEEDMYDEPEMPLGRTYKQQWENGDHDDDETVLSLEGVYTIANRWKEVDQKLNQSSHEKEFQQHITEFDQELEDFAQQEAACVDFLCSPDESALVSFLNELDDDLDKFVVADPCIPSSLDISFG